MNNSVIIVCPTSIPNPILVDYIDDYNRKGLNYCILHVSDEGYQHSVDFYKVSKKILRNYYKKEYSDNFNIKTIPLGYQSGIAYHSNVKDISVNFVGQIKSDRFEMLKIFESMPNKYFQLTHLFNDPNGLNTNQYSQLLSRSHFTLCPRGFISLDSFRINESLQCKSIPISVIDSDGQDYFKNIYGDHPFLIGQNWLDSFDKMVNTHFESKSKEVNDWWIGFKENLSLEIKDFILN